MDLKKNEKKIEKKIPETPASSGMSATLHKKCRLFITYLT